MTSSQRAASISSHVVVSWTSATWSITGAQQVAHDIEEVGYGS